MEDNQLLQGFLNVVRPIIVGCSGGVAALFISKTKPTLLALVSCVFVSGFAGWLVSELCAAAGVNSNFTSVATGIGGFYGPYTLRALGSVVGNKLGVDFEVASPKEQVEPAPCCEVGCAEDEESDKAAARIE